MFPFLILELCYLFLTHPLLLLLVIDISRCILLKGRRSHFHFFFFFNNQVGTLLWELIHSSFVSNFLLFQQLFPDTLCVDWVIIKVIVGERYDATANLLLILGERGTEGLLQGFLVLTVKEYIVIEELQPLGHIGLSYPQDLLFLHK